MRSLSSLIHDFNALRTHKFLQAYPEHVLVARFSPRDHLVVAETQMINLSALMQTHPVKAGPPSMDSIMFALTKRPDGIFSSRLSVGRAKTNDICIGYPEISGFHAYIMPPAQTPHYTVFDAGSKNGTWVRGKRLPPKQAVRLDGGDEIMFAHCVFTFYTPQGLHRLLQKLILGRGA